MTTHIDTRFLGLMKRMPGIYVPSIEVSMARERLVTNTPTRLKISGFDENFKRFIWPMVAVETVDIQAEYLAVYKLLAPVSNSVLLEALEATDEEAKNPAELNLWQYLFALAISAKQAGYRSLTSATLGFIRGIDGMVRMVSGTMRDEGLFFAAVLPEEESADQEWSPGDRVLGYAPRQQEMAPFLSLLSFAPPQQREAPSVHVM